MRRLEREEEGSENNSDVSLITGNLNITEQYEADHHPFNHVYGRVYALKFSKFSAARVISIDPDRDSRYEVQFIHGGGFRKMVRSGIIPLGSLTVGIRCFMREFPDDEMEEADIITVPNAGEEWVEARFTVKKIRSGTEVVLVWSKLFFTQNQAKRLVEHVDFQPALNLLPESRAARRTSPGTYTEQPTTSRGRGSKRRTNRTAGTRPKQKKTRVAAQQAETSSEEEAEASCATTEESETTQESLALSAIEAASNKLFGGLTFLLTISGPGEKKHGFTKAKMRRLLVQLGGKVFDDVEEWPEHGQNIYLISDNYYCNEKYIVALAHSAPCVSYQWIFDSINQQRLLELKKYQLPAGISIVDNGLKKWHTNGKSMLSEKHVCVHSALKRFLLTWEPVVVAMGATVVLMTPQEDAKKLDFLLTDHTCSENILIRAQTLGAAVVSKNWIVQSLIHGELLPADKHPRFKYDSIDADEPEI